MEFRYAECRYAECHLKSLYAECRYAESRYAECRGATLTMLYRKLPSLDLKTWPKKLFDVSRWLSRSQI